ncbi:MAG: hypothetical protein QNJ91_06080 [Gammaproteobacteria bacterium]|nr:hypothetical protein [Gammaproteobacteria bacterium]
MPSDANPDDAQEPLIRFGDAWIPAHDAWKKMETATVVVDRIDRFNENFPQLSSHRTRDVVPLVRRRLKNVELRMPRPAEQPDIAAIASGLLETLSPDDVLDALAERHASEMGLDQLIQLVGERPYLDALGREAGDFAMNRISPEQTAQLWNELGRPAPGGGLWSAGKIQSLLAEAAD